MRTLRHSWPLLVLALLMGGCWDGRPTRVPVSGRILINGEPLTTGQIALVPKNARESSGKIGPDGRFTLTMYDEGDGVTIGTHKVQIVAREPMGHTRIRWIAPPKLANAATSDVSVTIDGPTDDLVIDIDEPEFKPYIEETQAEVQEGGDPTQLD